MDLRVNTVSFGGKKEVLYGLTKAAKISRAAELTNKAYVTSRMGMTKYEERAAYDASIRAYFDMATNDSEFVDVINNQLSNKDIAALKDIVKSEKTDHGLVEPMNVFMTTGNDVASKNNRSSKVKDALVKLYELLK